MTAKKNKVTDKQADKQASGVTSSLLELLVAAKNVGSKKNLGPKKILGPRKISSQTNFWSKKN